MNWSFAIVNGRLAEIFFDEKKKKGARRIRTHCYVKKSEYKTKREQKWIREDTGHVQISYRNKKYRLLPPRVSQSLKAD